MVDTKTREAVRINSQEDLNEILDKLEIPNLRHTLRFYSGRKAKFFVWIMGEISKDILEYKINGIERNTVENNKVIVKISFATHFLANGIANFFSFGNITVIDLLKTNNFVYREMSLEAICIVKTETRFRSKEILGALTQGDIIDEEVTIQIYLGNSNTPNLILKQGTLTRNPIY